MDPITATLTITFAHMLAMQECGCDEVCGTGALGEQGPFQVLSLTQMKKLGCGDEVDWWSFDEAWPCVTKFLLWIDNTQECEQLGWTLAGFNWGIGNVLRFQREHGCGLEALKEHIPQVHKFAYLDRARRCIDGDSSLTIADYSRIFVPADRASRRVAHATVGMDRPAHRWPIPE